ncbi:MAG TPA: hypothetical protein PLV58_09665 [Campylobacterales bacterium]|nr:hypothetical protein [Campylobacterales bacterium]
MTQTVGARELLRNPSLLRIAPSDTIIVEDKKRHKTLGMYIGVEVAEEFMEYQKRAKMLLCAKKIAASSKKEYDLLEGSIDDGL